MVRPSGRLSAHAPSSRCTSVFTAGARGLFVALLLAGQSVQADDTGWRIDDAALDDAGRQSAIATVTSGEGDEVRVYRNAGGDVVMSFRLRSGYEQIAAQHCPTLTVTGPSLNVTEPGAPLSATVACETQMRGVLSVLGREADGGTVTPSLRALMQGQRMFLTVRLERTGYRHIEFSLKGSRRSLKRVLGGRIKLN